MKWLYVLAGIALGLKLLWTPNIGLTESNTWIIDAIVKDSNIPNTVSAIILRNRLYDTIFEVVVFSIAVFGVKYLLADESTSSEIRQFTDQPSVVLARLGATVSALVAIELAIRGHLSPGGGFASGVAGGTAIALVAITTAPETMQSLYKKWWAAGWEKISVLVFIVLSVINLSGVELPRGELGTLLSGSFIPILNVLVAIKVTLGSWAVTLLFIRYRGLL